METNKPAQAVKFYADCPDGKKNVQFNYKTHDVSHSIDLLNRFVENGFKIRMAWHHFANGTQMKLKAILPKIDGNTSGTYGNLKKLDALVKQKQQDLEKPFISKLKSTSF